MEEQVSTRRPSTSPHYSRFAHALRRTLFDINGIVLLLAIALLVILFTVLSNRFFTVINIRVIIETMSILTILSMGEHFLLVAGEIDISFVSVLQLTAVTASLASSDGALLSIAIGIVSAILVGLLNALFITKIGIPSFLVTLATMVGIEGVVLLISNYRAVLLNSDIVAQIFYGKWFFGLTSAVFWMILAVVFSGFLLTRTRIGRWVYATGGDERAARLSGIPTKRVKFILFVIMSILAGLAGMVAAGRSLAGRPEMGTAYLMPTIAAPILAGALLTGGRGSVTRTVLGALLLTIIINGVNLLGMQPAYQNIFMGVVLLGTLSVRRLRK